MLSVATYWWQPDTGSKFAAPYTAGDVINLARMVKQNLTVPHRFVCITDQPDVFRPEHGVVPIQIDRTTHVPGTCFVRLMTFHPRGREVLGTKVLQLDLDTLIVGNIDHLVKRDEPLVMWRNPGRVPWHNPSHPSRPYYNTSLLLHRCGARPDLWERFDREKPPAKDDQWYLSRELGPVMPYFDGARDGVYRIARQDTPGSGVWGDLPPNACIVTCPGSEGKPDNPVIRDANPWLAEYA